jgi:lytic cellulose monooxygenase (C1-hydroxylating)
MRAIFVAALAVRVLAHTIFQEVLVNGASQGRLQGVRYPTYDGYVNSMKSMQKYDLT